MKKNENRRKKEGVRGVEGRSHIVEKERDNFV